MCKEWTDVISFTLLFIKPFARIILKQENLLFNFSLTFTHVRTSLTHCVFFSPLLVANAAAFLMGLVLPLPYFGWRPGFLERFSLYLTGTPYIGLCGEDCVILFTLPKKTTKTAQ